MLFAALALAAASTVLAGPAAEPSRPAAPAPASADRTGTPAPAFTPEKVRAAVQEHVDRTVHDSGGVYRLQDPRTGKTLELEFVHVAVVSSGALWKVHDPGRQVDERASFGCVLFHAVGAPPESLYDVDMLVEPRETKDVVTDVRIHKEKRLVNGKWIWESRPGTPGGPAAKAP